MHELNAIERYHLSERGRGTGGSTTDKALDIIKNWKLTRVSFEDGALDKAGDVAKEMGMKNALVAIGGGSAEKSGQLGRLQASLSKAGVKQDLFGGVEPNPSVETIYRMALKLLHCKADGIVGLGGGSVLDACKAANVMVSAQADDIHPYFGVDNIKKAFKGQLLPFLPIPTTSGTSAEVTKYSNITDHALGVKKLISDETIIPKRAIVDPELTRTCPPALTRVVGLDTLTHLMEGYMNNVHDSVDPGANARAIEGMGLVFKYLPRAVKDGSDMAARRAMSAACVLGGTVIVYKSTGGPHMNSFSWFSVMDHGEATAVMLPYYTAYYGKAIPEKLGQVAGLMGLETRGDVTRAVVLGLIDFYKAIGQKTTLAQHEGFPKDFIEKAIADAAQNQMKLDAMPRPVPAARSKEILRAIIGGAWTGDVDAILAL
ncbi:MAG: iron-containing alcohol dehydrogenase [Candidatus Lokiarchaeota archaeon]|nr:iron-containing alcohol dehydrogenase [Candidatus Lokiarchaeota archaeon]